MKEHLNKLIVEFNTMENDIARFRFLMNHPGVFTLNLDNDYTGIDVSPNTCESIGIEPYSDAWDDLNDTITGRFHSWLGWSDGVCSLLEAIGMDHECV